MRLIFSRLVKNMVLNSGTMFFYAASLQIVIYPLLSRLLDPERFGQILANMAVVNVGGAIIATTLSNLLMKDFGNIDDKARFPDSYYRYNSCLFFLLISILPLIVWAEYYFLVYSDILITTIIVFIFSIRSYLLAELRINVNYLKIGLSRIVTVAGYLTGFKFYKDGLLTHPMFIICIGELATLIYIGFGSKLLRGGLKLKFEWPLLKRSFGLFLSVLSNSSINYSDRFVLSKVIGFNMLPTFFAACVAGRLIQMCFNVISHVLFSYLVNINNNLVHRYRLIIILFSIIFGFLAWLVLQLIAPFVVEILYPKLYTDAMAIIIFTNIAFAGKVSEIIVRPMVLRVIKIRWIALVDTLFAAIYLIGGVFAAIEYGIKGFVVCFSIFSIFKVVLLYLFLIFKRSVNSQNAVMNTQ